MKKEKHKILAIGAGGMSGLSGTHEYMFSNLAKKNDIVGIIDSKLTGFWKYYNIFYCYWNFPSTYKYLHPYDFIRSRRFSNFRQRTQYYMKKRTEASEKKIRSYNTDEYDIIFQTTIIPILLNKPVKPHCIFVDKTMKQSERNPYCDSAFLSEADKIMWYKLKKKTYENASVIFTASDNVKNSIVNDFLIDEEKVVTTYYGANIRELPTYEKKYDDNTILFVGRDFIGKGGDTLVKAFKEVKKEIKDAKLIIVGDSPNINIQDVSVYGYLKHSEALKMYKEASVFAMPSTCEAFGIVFLEAMANKMPCIGSSFEAMPEIIEEGETGFLVQPNDYKTLADRLVLLLSDENLMKKMGDKGRKRVEQYFTWDLVIDRMTKKFDEILDSNI